MHIIYQPDQEKETNRVRESQGRRLTVTYRTSLFIVVLLFIILAVWLVSMITPNRIGAEINREQPQDMLVQSASEDTAFIVHVVLPGETLWKLADHYGDPTQDKRKWIEQVKAMNELQDSSLFIGDSLVIPHEDLK